MSWRVPLLSETGFVHEYPDWPDGGPLCRSKFQENETEPAGNGDVACYHCLQVCSPEALEHFDGDGLYRVPCRQCGAKGMRYGHQSVALAS